MLNDNASKTQQNTLNNQTKNLLALGGTAGRVFGILVCLLAMVEEGKVLLIVGMVVAAFFCLDV